MTAFIKKGQADVLAFSIKLTMKPIVPTSALYLLSVQIVVEIIVSPAANLRSDYSSVSVTAFHRVSLCIKICYHSTGFIVFIR